LAWLDFVVLERDRGSVFLCAQIEVLLIFVHEAGKQLDDEVLEFADQVSCIVLRSCAKSILSIFVSQEIFGHFMFVFFLVSAVSNEAFELGSHVDVVICPHVMPLACLHQVCLQVDEHD
jgi:hypothetical protein